MSQVSETYSSGIVLFNGQGKDRHAVLAKTVTPHRYNGQVFTTTDYYVRTPFGSKTFSTEAQAREYAIKYCSGITYKRR